MRTDLRARPARSALAAAVCLAVGSTFAAAADRFAVDLPAGTAGSRAGAAALMHGLRAAAAAQHRPARVQGGSLQPVTSCSDDSSPGTLRAVLQQAQDGDTVDLGQLRCSTITMTQGAVVITARHLTLAGPGADRLAVAGNGNDRLLVSYGAALTLRDLTLSGGISAVTGYHVAGGACILAAYDVTLERATVSGCSSTGEGAYGGAIFAYGITLKQSTLSGNVAQGSLLNTLTASYGGGAFAYQSRVLLYDSTVSGNRAQADPRNNYGHYDSGGGVLADKGGYFYRSTVSGNDTDGTGGGFASHGGVLVLDSTISGNYAGRRGGGLFLYSPQASQVIGSTIAFNQAVTAGGGVYSAVTPQSFVLQSSILADNTASSGGDIGARLPLAVSGANNLVIAATANVALPADTRDDDPRLAALADNGGVTRTHALLAGSPAIDHGNNAAGLSFDQRGPGFRRVAGAAPDIGAFEAPAAVPPSALEAAPALSPWAAILLAAALLCAALRRRCGSG